MLLAHDLHDNQTNYHEKSMTLCTKKHCKRKRLKYIIFIHVNRSTIIVVQAVKNIFLLLLKLANFVFILNTIIKLADIHLQK